MMQIYLILVVMGGFSLFNTALIVGFGLYFLRRKDEQFGKTLLDITSSAMLHLRATSPQQVVEAEVFKQEASVKLDALEQAIRADASIKENSAARSNMVKGKNERGEEISIDLAEGRYEVVEY